MPRSKLCSLPVAERLELVDDLWDSIAEESGELRLTASHLGELDRRIDRFKESPDQGSDWNTLEIKMNGVLGHHSRIHIGGPVPTHQHRRDAQSPGRDGLMNDD